MKNYLKLFLAFVFCFVLITQAAFAQLDIETNKEPITSSIFSSSEKNIEMKINEVSIVTKTKADFPWDESDIDGYTLLQLGICFKTPDDGDWFILPGDSRLGEQEFFPFSFIPEKIIRASKDAQGEICGQLQYDLTNVQMTDNDSISLVISELYAAPREGSPCDDILHRYETNLEAQKMNLHLSCVDKYESDDIRSDIDYILTAESFNESTDSIETIQKEIEKILSPHVEGNWTFYIDNISEYIK